MGLFSFRKKRESPPVMALQQDPFATLPVTAAPSTFPDPFSSPPPGPAPASLPQQAYFPQPFPPPQQSLEKPLPPPGRVMPPVQHTSPEPAPSSQPLPVPSRKEMPMTAASLGAFDQFPEMQSGQQESSPWQEVAPEMTGTVAEPQEQPLAEPLQQKYPLPVEKALPLPSEQETAFETPNMEWEKSVQEQQPVESVAFDDSDLELPAQQVTDGVLPLESHVVLRRSLRTDIFVEKNAYQETLLRMAEIEKLVHKAGDHIARVIDDESIVTAKVQAWHDLLNSVQENLIAIDMRMFEKGDADG